jgi:hypothetical protein
MVQPNEGLLVGRLDYGVRKKEANVGWRISLGIMGARVFCVGNLKSVLVFLSSLLNILSFLCVYNHLFIDKNLSSSPQLLGSQAI